jgi:hypothetical protein
MNSRGTLEFPTLRKREICLRAIAASGLWQLGYSADRSGYEEYTTVCSWASLVPLTRVVAIQERVTGFEWDLATTLTHLSLSFIVQRSFILRRHNLSNWPTLCTNSFFYNKFIIFLYMFRALLCSSSGGQIVLIQHLVSSHSVGGRPVHI